ncbi:MAG: hypothetical protein ACF8PN_11655 [Phycisphaerales bacterium]
MAARGDQVVRTNPEARGHAERPGDRALVIAVAVDERDSLIRGCEANGVAVDFVESTSAAATLCEQRRYDLIIADFGNDRSGADRFREECRAAQPNAQFIAIVNRRSFNEAMRLIRTGFVDVLARPISHSEVSASCANALRSVRAEHRRVAQTNRLRQLCRRLNTARLDATKQVDEVCNDLVHAYQDLADQISHVTMLAEFTALIRQELDVEELLRTTLEYLLRRIGAMNAAVFMPNSTDEYTLGAYINYDCPSENADVLLDHLADVIAPRMIEEREVREFQTNTELSTWIGDDAAWLSDSHVIAFSCWHEDECLAIFVLFRDVTTPFPDDFASALDPMARVFGTQLAHVIHVHHRGLGDDDDWGDFGDSFDDFGGGLAA